MKLSRNFVFAIIAAGLTAVVSAQLPKATATLTVDKSSIGAGTPLTVHVSVTFPTGYHAYQNPPTDEFEIPVKILLSKGSAFKLVKVKYPKGVPLKVAGESKPSAVYTDTISIPVSLKAPAKAGPASISVQVSYQQCNASSCLPPDTITATAKVTVVTKKSGK